jgi:hypothetical protein
MVRTRVSGHSKVQIQGFLNSLTSACLSEKGFRPYCVTAITKSEPDGVAVYFFDTAAEALAKIRHLRGKKFRVKITGTNGKPVSEKTLEDDANIARSQNEGKVIARLECENRARPR